MGLNGVAKVHGTATVEDGENDEDIEAGPELPPEEEDNSRDDEEGRFFGGGITDSTADVLNFIDEQDKDVVVGMRAMNQYIGVSLTEWTAV